jgi:hypothetical protein
VAEKVADVGVDRFGHPVVHGEQRQIEILHTEHEATLGGDDEVDAALDTGNGFQGAIVKNVGRFGGPGGDGALARGDEEAAVIGAVKMLLCGQQSEGALGSLVVQRVG